MGGEYLPRYLPGEIEIARLVMESVTQDVISFRARRRRGGARLCYRVVDEYPEDWRYTWQPRSSGRPLTLRALIRLIDGAGYPGLNEDRRSLPDALRDANDSSEPEEMKCFVSVSSVCYPELAPYYDEQAQDWYDRQIAQRRADGYYDDDE